MKRVLINAPLDGEDVTRLGREVEIVAEDQGDIRGHIQQYAPFEAIIASAVIRLDGPLMDRLPGLEVIGRLGTGVDNVDIDAATSRGIAVVHTPEAPAQSTAEHAVALLYALAKDLVHQDRGLRAGDWGVRHRRVGRDLHELTLGIVGLGKIGSRVAQLVRPLEMQVLAYDPYVDPSIAEQLGARMLDRLGRLLPEVDVLTLHLPLNDSTRAIISHDELSRMKPTAWIINTSRGGLVDEQALIEALRHGFIAGAALDVFDPEPPAAENPLLTMENVILTPHRAFYTREGLARLSRAVVDQVLAGLRGDRPEFLANPEVWNHARCNPGGIGHE